MLPVIAGILVVVFFISMFIMDDEAGCAFLILAALVGGLAGAGYEAATTEDARTNSSTTYLSALSDSPGTTGRMFLGTGVVGSAPTYFYAYNTDSGITQDTVSKGPYTEVFIKEVDSQRAKKVVYWKETKSVPKDGWFWKFTYWMCNVPGTGPEWIPDSNDRTIVFEVPRGTVTNTMSIDTK